MTDGRGSEKGGADEKGDNPDSSLHGLSSVHLWASAPEAEPGKTQEYVGGGSGAFAMAMASRHAGLQAVVFDLPNVVPLTQRYVAAAGLSHAVTPATGDYLSDPLPCGFDVVFRSAVVHSNASASSAMLIDKCAAALNPGGYLVIVDWVMSPDRVEPAAGAMFAPNVLVAADGGDTYTEHEIRVWLAVAGLESVQRLATPFGTDVIMAAKQ